MNGRCFSSCLLAYTFKPPPPFSGSKKVSVNVTFPGCGCWENLHTCYIHIGSTIQSFKNSISLSIHVSIHLSIYSIYPSIHLFVCNQFTLAQFGSERIARSFKSNLADHQVRWMKIAYVRASAQLQLPVATNDTTFFKLIPKVKCFSVASIVFFIYIHTDHTVCSMLYEYENT